MTGEREKESERTCLCGCVDSRGVRCISGGTGGRKERVRERSRAMLLIQAWEYREENDKEVREAGEEGLQWYVKGEKR